jgi:hypothetical protein
VNGDGLYSSTNELNVLDRDLTINKLMKNWQFNISIPG